MNMIERNVNLAKPVAMLTLCDSRVPMPEGEFAPEAIEWNSVVTLPTKRQALRKFAAASGVTVEGDVVMELEKDIDLDFVLDAVVHKIWLLAPETVLTMDANGLREAGLLDVLAKRLTRLGIKLVSVTPTIAASPIH
jgi:hypothetical protein